MNLKIKLRLQGKLFLPIILFAGVVLGSLVASDFGTSPDESLHILYAQQTLEMYAGNRVPGDAITNLEFYGPAYNVAAELTTSVLHRLVPGWNHVEARHFVYFLSFLIAVFAFFRFVRRFVGIWATYVGTLLFALQPLYLGHAFINPKDIPFMAFFLLSVVLGFEAVDAFEAMWSRSNSRPHNFRDAIQSSLPAIVNITTRQIALLVVLLMMAVVVWLDLFVTERAFGLTRTLLSDAYRGESWPPVQALFARVAQDAWKTPLDLYMAKLESGYTLLSWLIAIGILLPVLYYSTKIWDYSILRSWIEANRQWFVLVLASVTLGICTAIRAPGPFAGLLVGVLLLIRGRRSALIPILAYGLTSFAIAVLIWPTLWGSPLVNFMATIRFVTDFPTQGISVYRGIRVQADQLPWDYLPILLGLQFTLVAGMLAVWGGYQSFRRSRHDARLGQELILIAVWIAVPLTNQILFKTPLYDNFRQVMFITPPIFIFACIGLDSAFQWYSSPLARSGITILLLLPGVAGIWSLHPYEYLYYNSLVDGVRGVDNNYKLDYMCTSYREAFDYINTELPVGSNVAIRRMHRVLPIFARSDLELYPVASDAEVIDNSGDYALICSSEGLETEFLEDSPIIWSLEKFGYHWVMLKQVP